MATPSSTTLSIHLSDRDLTPILSISRPHQRQPSQTQAQALSLLTTTAVSAFDVASRLGLGVPQRIMVESNSSGPILLHSYISPPSRRRPESRRTASHSSERDIVQQAREDMRPVTATPETNGEDTADESEPALVNGVSNHDAPAEVEDKDETEEENESTPPLLIATVVAPNAADVREARRTAAQMEMTGRDVQRQWTIEHAEAQHSATESGVEVGDG